MGRTGGIEGTGGTDGTGETVGTLCLRLQVSQLMLLCWP